ncbi:MAG: hypothetical protein ACHQJ6_09020, partial [Candidatus Berkiellales bacterium]
FHIGAQPTRSTTTPSIAIDDATDDAAEVLALPAPAASEKNPKGTSGKGRLATERLARFQAPQ